MLIRVEKIGKAALRLVLNRHSKRNALNIELMKELNQHLIEIEKDESIRVLLLEGEGVCFCSGLDLNEAVEREQIEESAELLKNILLRLYLSSKITIASIHGAALAGGAGLMSVCDVAVAVSSTKLGLTELKRGLVPAIILAFLKRKIPEGILREMILTGRIVTAEEAKNIGWIHYVVEEKEREFFVINLINQSLMSAPGAVFQTKNLLESFHERTIEEEVKMAEKVHRLSRESHEAIEGIQAFLEKREPKWSGLS